MNGDHLNRVPFTPAGSIPVRFQPATTMKPRTLPDDEAPPNLITPEQASEVSQRIFDAAEREIKDEREREARWLEHLCGVERPIDWAVFGRWLMLVGLVLSALVALVALLWLVPGGTP